MQKKPVTTSQIKRPPAATAAGTARCGPALPAAMNAEYPTTRTATIVRMIQNTVQAPWLERLPAGLGLPGPAGSQTAIRPGYSCGGLNRIEETDREDFCCTDDGENPADSRFGAARRRGRRCQDDRQGDRQGADPDRPQ